MVRNAVLNQRIFVAVALILVYVWRWQDFSPGIARLRVAAITTVASWAFLALAPNWPTLRVALRRPYTIGLLLWTAWMAVGIPVALNPDVAWEFVSGLQLKNVLFFLFLASTLSRARVIHILVLANIVGVSAGIYFYIKGGMPTERTPYAMYDRNDLALVFNMTIPLAVWAALNMREKWARAFCWGIASTGVVSVIGTQSRGGLLALGVISLLMLVSFKGITKKIKLALLVGVGLLLLAAPDAYWDRMSTLLDMDEDYNMVSDTGRKAIWTRGWGYFKDNPWTGVGAENFMIAERTLGYDVQVGLRVGGAVTHNSFLQILSETGLPGFLFWFGMIVSGFFGIRRSQRRFRSSRNPADLVFVQLGDAVFLSLLAYCVGGFFLSQAFSPYLLVLLAIVGGLQLTSERVAALSRARPRVPPTRPEYRPHHLRGSGSKLHTP